MLAEFTVDLKVPPVVSEGASFEACVTLSQPMATKVPVSLELMHINGTAEYGTHSIIVQNLLGL